MTTDAGTPRKCPAHFGMQDLYCPHGCMENCVVLDPRKVNRELSACQAELSRLRYAEMPEDAAIQRKFRDMSREISHLKMKKGRAHDQMVIAQAKSKEEHLARKSAEHGLRGLQQRAEAAEREVKRVTELHKGLMAEADKRVEAAESALKAQEKELELARKLHWLAAHDHIFFASYNDEIKDWDSGAHPAINCNDIFVPGADAESLKLADVDIFLKVCKEFPHHGDIAWCIVKRAEKPWRNYPEAEAIVPQVKAIINAALAQDEK